MNCWLVLTYSLCSFYSYFDFCRSRYKAVFGLDRIISRTRELTISSVGDVLIVSVSIYMNLGRFRQGSDDFKRQGRVLFMEECLYYNNRTI